MKKVCFVFQKVEDVGIFKKFKWGRKKILVKNIKKEMSFGMRRMVLRDFGLEREGVDLLLFCVVIKICWNFRRINV